MTLYSARDVAEITGLSYAVVRRAIKAGELRAAKIRSRIVVREQDLERWLDENTISPQRPTADLDGPGRRIPQRPPAGGTFARKLVEIRGGKA